jgi:uncharacterized glyoxalase superfamily protein PhnB
MRLATTQVWVHDQDVVLEFFTKKLGFEVRQDVTVPEMGNFRWLTIGLPSQDVEIVLMAVPGEPVMDATTEKQLHDLVGKGFATAIFFTTDDIDRDYAVLKAHRVEFTDEPEDRPYGRDCGFRDPSGNHYRLTQLAPIGLA